MAAAFLVLAFGQADSPRERPPGDGPTASESSPPEAAKDSEDISGEPGVPYMPSVGMPSGVSRGVFLDVALLSELRAQTLSASDSATTWGTDVELTPGIALVIGSPSVTLSLGYAPRLTVPFNVGGASLAVLNRATLRAELRVDPLWALTALGVFVVGDYSQLVPASTPGGAGPPPPVLNPVRSFLTYPYVGIDTQFRIDGVLLHRLHMRLSGGYFDVGGTGEVGQANQPRTWGPLADASLAWDASRTSVLTTAVAAQDWMMAGNFSIILSTLTESWKQSWTTALETTFTAGAGLSNRDVESLTAAGHFFPVASLRLDYKQDALHPLHVALEGSLSPYVDTYLMAAYQRAVLRALLDWRPSQAWQVGASVSVALAPHSTLAPESYGVVGASASYAPVPFLVLSAGGFSQSQFAGANAAGGSFRQWTTYFSLALRDKTAL